jgi:CRP-like cAMP-binding protein
MAQGSTQYETVSFERGQRIFKEGEKGRCAYLVKSGRVDLYRVLNNQEMALGSLEAGAIFGEMAVVTGERRNATALAGKATELVVLDRQLINKVLESSPPLMQKLVNLLFERLKSTTERLAEQPRGNHFRAVYLILDMLLRSRAQREGLPLQQVAGVNYQEFLQRGKELLGISTLEIGEELDKILNAQAAEVAPQRGPDGSWEHLIQIHDPDGFLEAMQALGGEEEHRDVLKQPFLDLADFAQAAGTDTETLRGLLRQEQLPETLIFFPRDSGLEWAQGQGRDLLGQG